MSRTLIIFGLVFFLTIAAGHAPLGQARGADVDSDLDTGRRAYFAGDYAAALAQLRPLAEIDNNPEAEYILGTMCSHGEGVPRDPSLAALWYESAARQGHADAAIALGFLLYEGAGEPGAPNAVAPDHAAAAQWFAQAAERGNALAQYRLGKMFLTGDGAARNEAAAQHWLLAAADQGLAGAQFELGLLLAREASPWSSIEAYKWFLLASRANYPGAAQNLRAVAARLDEPQTHQAVDMANGWQVEHDIRR